MYLCEISEDCSVSCWDKWEAQAIAVLGSGFCAIRVLYVLHFQFVKPMKTVLLVPFSHRSCKLSTSLCSTSSWSTCSLHSLSRYLGILLQKQLRCFLLALLKSFSPKMLQQGHADAGDCTPSAMEVSQIKERMVLAKGGARKGIGRRQLNSFATWEGSDSVRADNCSWQKTQH